MSHICLAVLPGSINQRCSFKFQLHLATWYNLGDCRDSIYLRLAA